MSSAKMAAILSGGGGELMHILDQYRWNPMARDLNKITMNSPYETWYQDSTPTYGRLTYMPNDLLSNTIREMNFSDTEKNTNTFF